LHAAAEEAAAIKGRTGLRHTVGKAVATRRGGR